MNQKSIQTAFHGSSHEWTIQIKKTFLWSFRESWSTQIFVVCVGINDEKYQNTGISVDTLIFSFCWYIWDVSKGNE